MSVLKCMFCGNRMHYHGEPEGSIPMEHYFCTADEWSTFEKENLSAVEVPCTESWRCKRCGTFTFFSDYVHVAGLYTPVDKFSLQPMQSPLVFGPFWDDIQWFDITEEDIPASEVFTKFPNNYWLKKNEEEMRIYKDMECTKCIAQYKRFQIPEKVTVATMSLESFKKMLVDYDGEVDFFYKKMSYEIIKEKLVGGKIRIVINRNFDAPQCKYSIEVDERENFVDNLVEAKIFDDGKSIVQAQSEVEL